MAQSFGEAAHQPFGVVLEVVVPNESQDGADLAAEIAPLAAAVQESGLQPNGVYMLPANHISNSAVSDYALPPEAAGPPGVSAYAPDAPGPRYDHVDFEALYAAGREAFGPHVMLVSTHAPAHNSSRRCGSHSGRCPAPDDTALPLDIASCIVWGRVGARRPR